MNNEIKYGGTFIAIAIALFLFFQYWTATNECSDYVNYTNAAFNGVLKGKYLNKKQRNSQTIEIDNIRLQVVHYEKSKFYDFVEVGDSLYKPQGSLELKVVRGDLDTTFVIDFGCKK